MPWVKGVQWQTAFGDGEFGARTGYATELSSGDLKLVIHTRWPTSPAILLHLKLLAQMVGHFYEAKQRESIERQNAYTHAIYETGARLTHDVKNLLQSLKSLCAAAATSTPQQAAALQALMQRQLPQITQRLNTTLEKLRSPRSSASTYTNAAIWWNNLLQRYNGRNIDFSVAGAISSLRIPAEVFDNVADNLIENALKKRTDNKDLCVRVTLSAADRGMLTVCDDGAPVPKSVALHLFGGPVASQTGFGVGLYQSSKLAANWGYVLALTVNEPGKVSFTLESAVAAAQSSDRQVA
jgi:C4-dicarboxylate-specific signal transduction histidine kinase